MPLDPTVVEKLHLLNGIASFDEAFADPEKSARLMEFLGDVDEYVPPSVRHHDDVVNSAAGDFRVRVYEPDTEPRSVFVWVHGGGFTGGTIDMPEGDFFSREICVRASAVVMSVDYAVAVNGVGYPTLHRQVGAAFAWARSAAPTWNIAPDRVAMGGGSAGANLVLGSVAESVDAGAPLPSELILAYPTAHRDLDVPEDIEKLTSSLPPLLRFTREAVSSMYDAYANGAADVPYLAMDGRSLEGFPPMTVIVDEYDDLRASGEALVVQAWRDGVRAALRLASGMLHGHFNRNAAVPQVDDDLDFVADVLSSGARAGQSEAS